MTINKIKKTTQAFKTVFFLSLLSFILIITAFAAGFNNNFFNQNVEKIAQAQEVENGYSCQEYGLGGYGEGCVKTTGGSNQSREDDGTTDVENTDNTNNQTNKNSEDQNNNTESETSDADGPVITRTARTGGPQITFVLSSFAAFGIILFAFIKKKKLSFKNTYKQRIKED